MPQEELSELATLGWILREAKSLDLPKFISSPKQLAKLVRHSITTSTWDWEASEKSMRSSIKIDEKEINHHVQLETASMNDLRPGLRSYMKVSPLS